MEFWQWPDHFLMVTWQRSPERIFSFLADHMTQDEVIEHGMKHFGKSVVNVSAMPLSQESWDLLEESFRKNGPAYILE